MSDADLEEVRLSLPLAYLSAPPSPLCQLLFAKTNRSPPTSQIRKARLAQLQQQASNSGGGGGGAGDEQRK